MGTYDLTFTLEIDASEPRIAVDRLAFHAAGTDWDQQASGNVWIEPVTRIGLLVPLPLTSAWQTNASGLYARLAKTAYTLITASKWVENQRLVAGDIYLESLGVNEVVTTTASYGINQAFYLSSHIHGGANETAECLRFGWGNVSTGVSVSVFASGEIRVSKGGAVVGVYGRVATGSNANVSNTSGLPVSLFGRTVSFLLIPIRGRELLVSSSTGISFSHAFADLVADGSQQTITPAGNFWWFVPVPFKASVSCAPLRFATSGTLLSSAMPVRFAPDAGSSWAYTNESHIASLTASATTSFVDATSLNPYISNGVNNAPGRVKVALVGDGTSSPFIYWADAVKQTSAGSTPNGVAVDISSTIKDFQLTVPADGPATLIATCLTRAINTLGVDRPTSISSRTFRLAVKQGSNNTFDFFRGQTAIDLPPRIFGLPELIEFTALDRTALFDDYTFASGDVPIDGKIVYDAVPYLMGVFGYSASSFEGYYADTIVLPKRLSSPAFQPVVGNSISSLLSRIKREFTVGFITGWAPTYLGYKYRYRSLSSAILQLSLYGTISDAYFLAADAKAVRVCRRVTKLKTTSAPKNRVILQGTNSQSGDAIALQYDDTQSQTSGLPLASRQATWRGRILSFVSGLSVPVSTQLATASLTNLKTEYAVDGTLYELECDFVMGPTGVPLWIGDKLSLLRSGTSITLQVKSFVLNVIFTGTGVSRTHRRRAIYQCEQVG